MIEMHHRTAKNGVILFKVRGQPEGAASSAVLAGAPRDRRISLHHVSWAIRLTKGQAHDKNERVTHIRNTSSDEPELIRFYLQSAMTSSDLGCNMCVKKTLQSEKNNSVLRF